MLDLDNTLQRILNPIRVKLFLLIGRSLIKSVSNSGNSQLIQVTGLKNETLKDIDHPQPYGFESYVKITDKAEAIIFSPNGDRGKSFVGIVQNTQYRPKDLKEGEVQMYDYNGSKVYLRSDGTVRIEDKNGNFMESSTTQWNLNDNFTVDK
jgi:phage gp45-like